MQEINHQANPFPGLRPFESTETHLFFGRDGQSEELLRRLKRTRFLAVVGTSGSGKSSLVRAGLLPALQGGLMASAGSDWRIAILRPGDDPIGNLARALSSPAVLGSRDDEKSVDMQSVLAETTLRRSSLGLVELVRRARTKLDGHGRPTFPDYENLLVVVDQFEELFRFKQLIEEENSKEDAAAFVKLLLEAVAQKGEKIYVVLTMRSDFLGDCSQFWELPETINNGQYLIPRMTRDERREAITGPVAVGEGAISEPLVNQLLNDVGDNPDQLPILQHALMRTWDYWLNKRLNGEPIDIPHYEAIGGMASALSRHADEAYEELSDAQKVIAEKLFKGLTEKGTDNREIRRPMEVQEICELTGANEAEVIAVIEVFRREGRSFLMPPPKDAVTGAPVHLNKDSLIDISHESLIRNWEHLKTWTEEEAQSARIYKRLAETAVLHKAGEEALMKDPALQVALDWRDKNMPNAVWARRYHPEFETAMSFLDVSAAARDVEARESAMQQRKEVSYKRTKLVAFILAFSVLLSLGSAGYAFRQGARAERARVVAEQKTAEALEQRKFADSQRQRANDEALQAGFARNDADEQRKRALDEQKKAEEESARAEQQAGLARRNEEHAKEAQTLALQQKVRADAEAARANAEAVKNRQLLYPADINLAQQAYESSNVERVRELLGEAKSTADGSPGFEWYYLSHLLDSEKSSLAAKDTGLIVSITSPNGKTLAIGAGQTVELQDIGADEKRFIPLPDEFSIGSLAFSPNGKKLAVGHSSESAEATIRLYDTESRKEIGSLRKGADAANSLVFSPDGQQLIVGGGSGSVSLWDIDSSLELEVLPAKGSIFLDISRDGKMLAAGSIDSEMNTFPVLLWDMTAKEKVVKELVGHGGKVTSVAFTPDGKTLATGSLDKTVRLWDTKSRTPLRVLSFGSSVFSLAFTPDGQFLAIGYQDGSIKLYDTKNKLDGPTLIGHHQAVTSLSFSTNGKLLFSSDNKYLSNPDDALLFKESSDTRIKSWDLATLIHEQAPFTILEGKSYPAQLAYSSDSKALAIVSGHRNVSLLDAETNGQLRTLSDQKHSFVSVAFSPDHKLIATASANGYVMVWTGKQISKTLKQKSAIYFLTFSPDSKLLAIGSWSAVVQMWDTTSWKLVYELHGEENSVGITALSFLPDDKLRVFYSNGIVELWDIKLKKPLSQFRISRKDYAGPIDFSLGNLAVLNDSHRLAVSHDSHLFAVSFDDGIAVLYDAATGNQLATFKCQAVGFFPLAFSPDNKILVTGGNDGTVKLWDTASQRELLTLRGQSYPILSVTFSPDGTKLAAIDQYNHLRVWRAPRGNGNAVGTKAPGDSR